MREQNFISAKITRPRRQRTCERERLFQKLDEGRAVGRIWISGMAGAGKTTLVASYLDSRKLPCIWYQLDEGDGDIASFFHYLAQAVGRAVPRNRKPLPALTPEHLQNIPIFSRRFFEEFFRRINSPAAIVFDNYQDVPLSSGFHDLIARALEAIPEGITIFLLSRGSLPLRS